MAQEFTINSSAIESKINQLLPSQGGFGAGVDFSASTMVIPIVDLTESAEGSGVRQDLQTASSFSTDNTLSINSDNLITNTKGYFQLNFAYNIKKNVANNFVRIYIDDGTTEKDIFKQRAYTSGTSSSIGGNGSVVAFLSAGKELRQESNSAGASISVSSHQIADISGNLSSPL